MFIHISEEHSTRSSYCHTQCCFTLEWYLIIILLPKHCKVDSHDNVGKLEGTVINVIMRDLDRSAHIYTSPVSSPDLGVRSHTKLSCALCEIV